MLEYYILSHLERDELSSQVSFILSSPSRPVGITNSFVPTVAVRLFVSQKNFVHSHIYWRRTCPLRWS